MVLSVLGLVLFCCGTAGCAGAETVIPERPEEEETPSFTMTIDVPESVRYGEKAEVSARCSCGRPVTLVPLDSRTEILSGILVPKDVGAAEIGAFHEDGSHFESVRIAVQKGIPEEIGPADCTVRYGESPVFPQGISLADGEEIPEGTGTFVLRATYCPDERFYEYIPAEIRLTVEPGAPEEVSAPEWGEIRYVRGMKRKDIPLPEGFAWQEPEMAVSAGTLVLTLEYRKTPWHEAYVQTAEVRILPGLLAEEEIPPPEPETTFYDEEHTVGEIGLAAGWRWTDDVRNLVPAVDNEGFAAVYEEENFEPVTATVRPEILPKDEEMPETPELRTLYVPSRNLLLPEWARATFFFAEEEPLDVGTHQVVLCWQKNENYAVKTRTITLTVSYHPSYFAQPPSLQEIHVVSDAAGNRVLQAVRPGAIEFRAEGGEWVPDKIELLPGVPVEYRYCGTANYAPSDSKIFAE